MIFDPGSPGATSQWSSTWSDDYSQAEYFPIYGNGGPPFAGFWGHYGSANGIGTTLPGYPAQNSVYYRCSNSTSDVTRMSQDIAAAFPLESPFNAMSVIVATWFAVSESDNGLSRLNTFQVQRSLPVCGFACCSGMATLCAPIPGHPCSRRVQPHVLYVVLRQHRVPCWCRFQLRGRHPLFFPSRLPFDRRD